MAVTLLRLMHWTLIAAYLLAPPAAVLLAAVRSRRVGRVGPLLHLLVTALTGLVLGAGLTAIYARVGRAPFPAGQALLAGYFGVALLVLMRGFDAAVTAAARWGVGRLRKDRAKSLGRAGVAGVQLARLLALVGVGLPWVMGAVMVYRPKVLPADDPQAQLGMAYQPVTFRSSDGVELAGWWIPSQSGSSERTVIVCHGLGAGKSNQLILAGVMATGDFNALIFDFRAHGSSGGQLSSFGDLEKRDVLAAVRWTLANRPAQAKHLYGLGVSMGGAALIGAATDPAGRPIEAVAVFSTYDRLSAMARDVPGQMFYKPFAGYFAAVALPVMSLHTGADLADFAPADQVGKLWPRPVFVLHGAHDEIIPLRRGRALYDAASFPRQHLWVQMADHDGVVNDPAAVRAVRAFFLNARAKPLI